MSGFYVTISLGDPQGERFEEVRALVDTGATLRHSSGQAWTWVPRDVLERLGHRPTVKRRFRTADNRIIEREAASVLVRLGDESLPTLCVFGDEGSEVLLGVTAMETFSVAPDPVNERLAPVAGLLTTVLD